MIEYKGYIGIVNYDSDAKIFHGDVINTKDVITFQGTSVKEIESHLKNQLTNTLNGVKKKV